MNVTLNSAELVPGLLPNVCVKTGEPAQTTRKAVFRYTPPWVYALLLVGIGIFIVAIIQNAVATKVTVMFPVSDKFRRQARRRRSVALATMVGAPVAIIAMAILVHNAGPIVLAVLLFLIGAAMLIQADNWISGRLRKDGTLTIKRVSPEWAQQRAALVQSYVAQQQAYAYAQQVYAAQYAAQQYPGQQQSGPGTYLAVPSTIQPPADLPADGA